MSAQRKTQTIPRPMMMTEDQLQQELTGSLVILSTSSPDKREIYRQLFSAYAPDKKDPKTAGVNFFFTDSGALKIVPKRTPEMTGGYDGNLDEKAIQQIRTLGDKKIQSSIRKKINHDTNNEFDPKTVNIMGMTEDSGWQLKFGDEDAKRRFVDLVTHKLEERLRPQDARWLLNELRDKKKSIADIDFPGPNLKPIQEHLEGGFHSLMDIIYKTAHELDLPPLQYTKTVNISFASPRSNKFFSKSFESSGFLTSRDEYEDQLLGTKHGEAINSDFIHVPDGQGESPQTISTLLQKGLHSKSIADLPADYARRDLTEWLQELIGKRRSTRQERLRDVNIACVTPNKMDGIDPNISSFPAIHDLKFVPIPKYGKLKTHPHVASFEGADIIVLSPNKLKNNDHHLRHDPNYGLVLNFVVTAMTDPESMGVPIVLDNRSHGFDKSLELITSAFAEGRLMGDRPVYVANTKTELNKILVLLKDIKQRAPVIRDAEKAANWDKEEPPITTVPSDGIFTLFIGGGHANNSKKDLDDAKDFGYHCAQQNWRIVTGAGSVEGSMGATHTGFIQYHLDHLDQLQLSLGYDGLKRSLTKYVGIGGKYNAEEIILKDPKLINKLADAGFIPRDMFYGYSMKPLLEMESASGEAPPGIRYFDAGNRIRRLEGLLSSGTKVFMPGGIGTDEEFEETVKQHLEARVHAKNGVANDNAFTDGTPNDGGTMIIYNRSGHLDKLLRHYMIAGDDPMAKINRKNNNIKIVTSLDELKEASNETADGAETWLQKIRESRSGTQPGVGAP